MPDNVWSGCVLPDDLLYDVERNVWVRLEDGDAVLGMTDVAQTLCGRFVHVTWKRPGKRVARGRPLAVIESAKWVGPFPSPLTGEIVAINERALAEDIAIVNRDPYGAGWLVRLRPTSLETELPELSSGEPAFERYKLLIEEQGIHCFRCAD